MLSELSDDDFCETNFLEPSPVKRSALLPPAKERNEQEIKKEELRRRIYTTEKECFNVIDNSLKVKEEELEISKVIQVTSGDILFSPKGRTFFEPQEYSRDELQPFLWLDNNSSYREMTLDEFLFNFSQDMSFHDGQEENELLKFCLNILVQETDGVIMNLLVNFLSKHVIPFDAIKLKEWGGPSLSCLVHLISKSVSEYNADEARDLFRQACLAALDMKTFSMTTELRTLISECLINFAVQYKVLNEVDWLISLDLKPEESFRIIEALPTTGLYVDLNLCFAWKILPTFLGLQNCHLEDYIKSWHKVMKFLEENESKIRNLPPNFYFCFMYILKFIVTRIPEDDKNSVKEMLKVVDGLKLQYIPEKGNMSHYLSMEAMNRLYLVCNEHINS